MPLRPVRGPNPAGRLASRTRVEIPRPPAEVFPWLLEEDKVPQWTGNLERYRSSTGALGDGSRVRQVLEVSGRADRRRAGDHALRPAERRRDAFSTNGIEVVSAYALEAAGGGTRLTQSLDAKPSGADRADARPGRPAAAGDRS